MLPLAELLTIIYNSNHGKHGIRGEEDHTRDRALLHLVGKIKAVLEFHKKEEEGFEERVVSEADDNDDSGKACSILSSDTSEAGSVAQSEYTVKSIASWKERTSWFFRLAGWKKNGV